MLIVQRGLGRGGRRSPGSVRRRNSGQTGARTSPGRARRPELAPNPTRRRPDPRRPRARMPSPPLPSGGAFPGETARVRPARRARGARARHRSAGARCRDVGAPAALQHLPRLAGGARDTLTPGRARFGFVHGTSSRGAPRLPHQVPSPRATEVEGSWADGARSRAGKGVPDALPSTHKSLPGPLPCRPWRAAVPSFLPSSPSHPCPSPRRLPDPPFASHRASVRLLA